MMVVKLVRAYVWMTWHKKMMKDVTNSDMLLGDVSNL